MQGMGYWVLANWLLHDLEGEDRFREWARFGANVLCDLQRENGSWPYPLRERRHLVATIEGNWAALALLASFRRSGEEVYRAAASGWVRFLLEEIGFQGYAGTLAVNYFDRPRGNIPNNSTNTLWLLAEHASLEPTATLAREMEGMKAFLRKVQRPNGELPYILGSPHEPGKTHYLCYQYNAFECLDLCHYYERTGDADVEPVLRSLVGFLLEGLDEEGHVRASCLSAHPRVLYYTAAVSAALWKAARLGLSPSLEAPRLGMARLLDAQLPDGSFPYSSRDYGFLRDGRSYPRYLAMILYFFCLLASDWME